MKLRMGLIVLGEIIFQKIRFFKDIDNAKLNLLCHR